MCLVLDGPVLPLLEIEKACEIIGELGGEIASLIDWDLFALRTQSVVLTRELVEEDGVGLLGGLGPHASINKME